MTVSTVELSDQQWIAEREAMTQLFLGVSAAEFVERFAAGGYDDCDEPDGLMAVLALFPELD